VHDFTCNAKMCKGKGKNPRLVRRYLDTSDKNSSGSLHRHAKLCWGEENIARADEAKNIEEARRALKEAKLINGTITAVFERTGKGKVTYSARQHTKSETRYVLSLLQKEISNKIIMLEPKLLNGFPRACDPSALSRTKDLEL
jgi:hypothetical protein